MPKTWRGITTHKIKKKEGEFMKELEELYDAIKEVVSTCEEMNLRLDCVENLKEKYNNLCEDEEEQI
jgi:hypothetical protein